MFSHVFEMTCSIAWPFLKTIFMFCMTKVVLFIRIFMNIKFYVLD